MRSPLRSLRPCLVVFAAVTAILLVPGHALAVSPVTTDCNAHNKLTQSYTVSELRNALATMPADVKEYTSCYQIIQDELYRKLGQTPPSASGTGSSGGGGSSSFLSTPVLIVLIIVILLGAALAFIASRRGGGGGPPSAGGPGGGSPAT